MNCTLKKWNMLDTRDLSVVLSNKKIQDNLRDGLPSPYTDGDGRNFISSILSSNENDTFAFAIMIDNNVKLYNIYYISIYNIISFMTNPPMLLFLVIIPTLFYHRRFYFSVRFSPITNISDNLSNLLVIKKSILKIVYFFQIVDKIDSNLYISFTFLNALNLKILITIQCFDSDCVKN